MAERAAAEDAQEKASAHQATVERLAHAAAEASAVASRDQAATAQDLVGVAACKRLASETRACMADEKRCRTVDPVEFQACSGYMGANGLERNPF